MSREDLLAPDNEAVPVTFFISGQAPPSFSPTLPLLIILSFAHHHHCFALAIHPSLTPRTRLLIAFAFIALLNRVVSHVSRVLDCNFTQSHHLVRDNTFSPHFNTHILDFT